MRPVVTHCIQDVYSHRKTHFDTFVPQNQSYHMNHDLIVLKILTYRDKKLCNAHHDVFKQH